MRVHRLVVDRIEGDLAVVEVDGGTVLDLPRWLLPGGVRESDVVTVAATPGEDGALSLALRVDAAATAEARDAVAERLARLRGRDPGGDIQL